MDEEHKKLIRKVKDLDEKYSFLISCVQLGFFFTNLFFIVIFMMIIKYARVAQW